MKPAAQMLQLVALLFVGAIVAFTEPAAAGSCPDYLYHSNGKTFKSGDYLYHANGKTLKSGSYLYNANGKTLKSGSYFYHGNGKTAKSGDYLYRDDGSSAQGEMAIVIRLIDSQDDEVGTVRASRTGQSVIRVDGIEQELVMSEDGDLTCSAPVGSECPDYVYHRNGKTLKSGDYLYHSNGKTLKSGSYLYNSNGKTLKSGDYFYHHNGKTARSGTYLYDEEGKTIPSKLSSVTIEMPESGSVSAARNGEWSVISIDGIGTEFIMSADGKLTCR